MCPSLSSGLMSLQTLIVIQTDLEAQCWPLIFWLTVIRVQRTIGQVVFSALFILQREWFMHLLVTFCLFLSWSWLDCIFMFWKFEFGYSLKNGILNIQHQILTGSAHTGNLFYFTGFIAPFSPFAGAASSGQHLQHLHWTWHFVFPPDYAAIPGYPGSF